MADRQTIHDFVKRHDIGIAAERAYRNPNMAADEKWAREASHYHVTLRFGRKSFTTFFSMGSALKDPPRAEDILNSLALDSSSYDNASGFEDWARDLGMEWDSSCEGMSERRAEEYGYDCKAYFEAKRTYRVVGQQRERLEKFLGSELYEELLYQTESL